MKYQITQITYDQKKLHEESPQPLQPSGKEVAVVFHVFYIDLWPQINTYLNQIDTPFDLYVTVPEHMDDMSIMQIFSDRPDVTLFRTENRGRDVLPFLQVMRLIGTDTYPYICKLHTKKTADSKLGHVWRKLLYYDLLGSKTIVRNIIEMFKNDPEIGIVTGKNTILDSQRYTYGNDVKIEHLAKLTGIIYDPYYLFPAGTMFWTHPEIVAPIVKELEKGTLHFEEEAGQKDNTLAHAIERFFGIIAQSQHKKIVESPSRYSELDDKTLDEVASLVLSQQYVGNNVFAMQKQKIEEQNRYISYLEELADSMRIKNRIKNIYSDKILPVGKKLLKIPRKLLQLAKVLKNNPALLKKILYYLKRGEFGYMIKKIREKTGNNLSMADQLTEVSYSEYFLPEFDTSRYTTGEQPVDIIIPVYNGYEFLQPLFDSIEANTSAPYRLIVVNDASPDERVKPYLEERLAKHADALFIDHGTNQGFLKSVNEAYTHTKNHFVLLNTDTEVPSFWLERLMYPIIHLKGVASTTPFTNSGEIASFPNFVADNDIFDGMPVEDLDKSFKKVHAEPFYTEVPTGVGFCMGVNKDVATQIGMFDEDTFGKGYGEENDWCQRAIKAGYRNLIVPNLFVYHKHGGSFSAEEKQALLQQNAVKLLERHPDYGKDVNAYIEKDPHKILRHLLVLNASAQTHPIHLIFDHALGGGANHYTQERIDQYISDSKNVLLVSYDYYSHCYILRHRYREYDFSFKITPFENLKAFLDHYSITEIFLNNLVSYPHPYPLLEYINALQETNEADLIVPIHDFYPICPSYNLLDEKGRYCGVPDIEQCKTCMQHNMQEWRNFYQDEVDIGSWRKAWQKLLAKSKTILFFSQASKEIFRKAYPDIDTSKLLVTPHTVSGFSPLRLPQKANQSKTTIGILGAINHTKGAQIVKQLVQQIERDNLDIDIVVIGEITEPIRGSRFHSTGKYSKEDLPEIIREHHIDIFLIPSIWPETFSYTTQEIMMMELPLMVFDLGAPAERVKEYEKGYVIPQIDTESILNTVIQFKADSKK